MRVAYDDIETVQRPNKRGHCAMCGKPYGLVSVEATYDAIDGPAAIKLCLLCAMKIEAAAGESTPR